MHIKRQLTDIIRQNKKSFLLLGPRQTGKSTLIQSLKPDLSLNLADQQTFIEFLSDPTLIKKQVRTHKTVFIDEIQRIPTLLNTLQVMMDEDKARRFFLTGSSARKLKRGKANLLPGRLLTYELGPLTLSELGNKFEPSKALRVGLLPGIYLEQDERTAKKTLLSYAATYLKEEVQAEALTKNLEGFSRFFSVVTAKAGDALDFTKVAKEAAIERMSARRYYDILIDTLIVQEVPPFSKSLKRRLIQHPKFYLFDVGVYNACLNNFETSEDRIGMLFEHLVLQLITSTAKGLDEPIRVSTYRTESHAEVDFIVERGKEILAIEVKASKKIHATDLRGLKSFGEFFGKKHKPLVIYRGERELTIDKVPVLPLENGIRWIFPDATP